MCRIAVRPADSVEPGIHEPTLVAISFVVWSLFAVLHEIVGHGGAAILLGEDVRGAVTTTIHIDDFYDLARITERIGWWGFRLVASAGTLVNFVTGGIALLLLRSKWLRSPSWRLSLWLFASISLFQQAFWVAVMPFLGQGGDWTAFVVEIKPPFLWKSALTVLGLVFMWVGWMLPMRLWRPSLGFEPADRKRALRELTTTPFAAAFILQFLSVIGSPLSGPRHTYVVAVLSFIPMLLWMVLINKTRWEFPSPFGVTIRLSRGNGWLAAGTVAFILFVFILGTGIGSFEGHPDY